MPKDPENISDLPSEQAPASGGGGGMLPVILVLILVPVITIGIAEFYLFPKVQEIVEMSAPAASHGEEDAHGGEHGAGGGHAVEHGDVLHTYEFADIVANLRGAMKSRYLKVSFTLESHVVDFEHLMQVNEAKIRDRTLSVLTDLTLQDLEEPGIKNIIRSDLLNEFADALKGNVIENLYFSSLVVQ